MKLIAINGSPRKHGNTGTLLKKAFDGSQEAGAETELINLYDLNYKGCTSCFECKLKNSKIAGGVCAMRDDLTPVLERVLSCHAIILGSPIYMGNVTGEMRSFMERLIFPSDTYNKDKPLAFVGKVSSGFIYTMNKSKSEAELKNYPMLFKLNQKDLEKLNGSSEFYTACDTYQFSDYSKYDVSKFNEVHKTKVKETQFPQDCKIAFEMGYRLASIS